MANPSQLTLLSMMQRKEVGDFFEHLIDKCEFSTIEDVLKAGLKQ